MDIRGGKKGPSGALSNFTLRLFSFDGVFCVSMEGLLQSFKFEDPAEQERVCLLSGFDAKNKGLERNEIWQKSQTLWWKGQAFDRHSTKYQLLLDEAFLALATNPDFLEALRATGEEELTHSVGVADPSQTVLTEEEFCSRLLWLRKKYCH